VKTTTIIIAAVLLVGAVGSCTPLEDSDAELPPPTALEEPALPDTTDVPDRSDTAPAPENSLSPCSGETRQAIEDTVVGQVSAFSDGDFEEAYSYASPSFQAGVPLEVFRQIISVNYPQLLDATNARSGPCEADVAGGVSTIVMRFDTALDPTYTLRYVLELVEDQWRIAGASQEPVADTVA
jgi:hypothetical protein